MERHLDRLPDLHADVLDSMPNDTGGGGGTPVSGTKPPRLPVNLEAAEVAGQIEHDTRYWVNLVAETRGLNGPTRPSVTDRCVWLSGHVAWLSASDHAAEVKAVLAELVGRAFRVISPMRRPIQLGPHPGCDGTLRATVTNADGRHPAQIWCDGCTLEVGTKDWWSFGVVYGKAAAEDSRELASSTSTASA
jgi:hypothetical protein